MAVTILGAVNEFPATLVRERSERVAPKQRLAGFIAAGLFTRKRGVIQHWTVPPAFEAPGRALSELGVEAYKQAVADYYAQVREMGVEQAKRAYSRWVARKLVSSFETEVRKFRRHNGERGTVQGMLIDPLELYKSARLMVDVEYIIRRWQVAPEHQEGARRLLVAKLEYVWGLK